MKITAFDDFYPLRTSLGGGVSVYSSGSNDASGDVSGAGDVVGEPADFSVVGLRNIVSLASNIGGGVVGDVLTIIGTTPRIAAFATPSNTGGASFGSNATRVSEMASVGALSTSAREDHRHDGIGTITASSSNTLQRGTVNLRPGSNVTFGLTDTDGDGEHDTLTINSTAAGAGGGGDAVGQFIAGWDGGGSTLNSGKAVDIVIPFTGTITSWTLLADVSGSAVVDIGTDTYAGFPTFTSIVAAAAPTLTTATKATSSTLTGWTTAVTAGDILRFTLSSVSTVTRLLCVVAYTRP